MANPEERSPPCRLIRRLFVGLCGDFNLHEEQHLLTHLKGWPRSNISEAYGSVTCFFIPSRSTRPTIDSRRLHPKYHGALSVVS